MKFADKNIEEDKNKEKKEVIDFVFLLGNESFHEIK